MKIYATDVDEDALATARQATYSDEDLQGLPAGAAPSATSSRPARPVTSSATTCAAA